ncbi:uncharacterized protein LOC127247741 [Andrographis paniculata]|uniref:uncharacterized protein LOC127247741 n=1 Tax=Andrographis paniculata TaxID=175694 RepID=UPI0021E86EA6|nr:uncharacterized protein LOC127247741 [Andrographis paniculata]
MDMDRPHFRTTASTTATANASATASASAAATSELFICFSSRLSSSSSMKLSKSILSPGRAARDSGPVSLSSSLSRRLRTNGSLKGGQASPFFSTTTGRKRGCGFENPEPSSPKVTCIGQVRVKTKKKAKQQQQQQNRSLSRRRSGEVSFRKIEQGGEEEKQRSSNGGAQYQYQYQQPPPPPPPPPPQECLQQHRNQRWVHLPVSICEALRGFGAEFSCLLPCSKSSCFSTREKEDDKCEKQQQQSGSGSENGCGAVFARWLVSVNDGEGGRRREIELVVGGGDEEEEERMSMRRRRSSRRHVFEDIEIEDDRIKVKGKTVDERGGGAAEEAAAAARVSICIPPKNALLLMRCRSDPMKMAALANRFSWDARAENDGNGHFAEKEEEENKGKNGEEVVAEEDGNESSVNVEHEQEEECFEEVDAAAAEPSLQLEEEIVVQEELQEPNAVEDDEDNKTLLEEEEEEAEEEEEVESNMSSFEALLDQENAVEEPYQDCLIQDNHHVEDAPIHHSPLSEEEEEEIIDSNQVPSPPCVAAVMDRENEATQEEDQTDSEENDDSTISVNNEEEENRLKPLPETPDNGGDEDEEAEDVNPCKEEEEEAEVEFSENPDIASSDEQQIAVQKEKGGNPVLPECLLLMMCEPKLSMEVSKETWVCTTDFIRWLPERPRKSAKATNPPGGGDNDPASNRRLSIDSKANPLDQQPPRSSCSSMATMIEQKLVNAVGYEPFVLTRCKSEPMRSAAAKLMPLPDSCCWKNSMRKLEPHRGAPLGVGAAGVGF